MRPCPDRPDNPGSTTIRLADDRPSGLGYPAPLGEVEDRVVAMWGELARDGSPHPLEAVSDGRVRSGRKPLSQVCTTFTLCTLYTWS